MTDEWSWSTNDRIVKLADNWVRVSAIQAVEATTSGQGCRVLLSSGASISLAGMTPDRVVDLAYREVQR